MIRYSILEKILPYTRRLVMFPLSDIINYSDSRYTGYILKKTHFFLNSKKQSHLRYFWNYLIANNNFRLSHQTLSVLEKKALYTLLANSGYMAYSSYEEHLSIFDALEKKLPWIFKHPLGGIFIPIEAVKLLVQEGCWRKSPFLFSILFKLSLKEQYNLLALLQQSFTSFEILQQETNRLDMMLMLYVALLNFNLHTNTNSHVNNMISLDGKEFTPICKPTPLWDYLYAYFPCSHDFIDEWFTLMHCGQKPFYHSLLLIRNRSAITSLLLQAHILPYNGRKNLAPTDIQIITPQELRHFSTRLG